MERIPRQFYTLEFKEEAVSLVVDGGLTVAEVGRRLSISEYLKEMDNADPPLAIGIESVFDYV